MRKLAFFCHLLFLAIFSLSCSKGIINAEEPPYRYVFETTDRQWQGIPTVEVIGKNIFVAWYTGGDDEGPDNYVTLYKSGDLGETWKKDILIIDPPGNTRAFDPVLWRDTNNKLWLFWNQSEGLWDGTGGVWAKYTEDIDSDNPNWSLPIRLTNGVLINKPVFFNSQLLFPIANWKSSPLANDRNGIFIYSADLSKMELSFKSRINVPFELRTFDEPQLLPISENLLACFFRTNQGIFESISEDLGNSWSVAKPFTDAGRSSDSKFNFYRLKSDNVILVKNNSFGREKMTIHLSTNNIKTWDWELEIDPRNGVSYPDITQSENGDIYIVYDRNRYHDKEIILLRIREMAILNQNISNALYFILK